MGGTSCCLTGHPYALFQYVPIIHYTYRWTGILAKMYAGLESYVSAGREPECFERCELRPAVYRVVLQRREYVWIHWAPETLKHGKI